MPLLSQQPAWQGAWDKGIAYYEMALKYPDAIEQFSTVIESEPRFAEAYFRRGLAHTRLLHLQDAIADFRKALSLQPSLATAYLQEMNKYKKQDGNTTGLQAIFLVAAKKPSEALPLLDKCLDYNIFSEDIVKLYKALANLESGKNTAQGCQDCQTAYNLGQTEIASALLKKYCTNKAFISFSTPLSPKQFIPRTSQDSGFVEIAGTIAQKGIDSLVLELQQKKPQHQAFPFKRVAVPVRYKNTKDGERAEYSLKTSIRAGLYYYSAKLFVKMKQPSTKTLLKDSLLHEADSLVCGDVYVCSGQSNMMLGKVPTSEYQDFMRTFVFNDKAEYWQPSIATNGGKYLSGAVGGFPGGLQKILVEQYKIPVLIINGAVGGSSMADHLVENPVKVQPIALNELLISRVKSSGLHKFVKAVFWYQGESDNNDNYFTNFSLLCDAWKKNFPALQKVYVAQIRAANCENDRQYAALRETQRRFSEKLPFVQSFATNAVPFYDGCHFSDSGYFALAQQASMILAKDFYGSSDTTNILSPSISKAYYSSNDSTELTLEFSPATTVFAPPSSIRIDTSAFALHQAFTADVVVQNAVKRDVGVFSGISVMGNNVILRLSKPHHIKSVSYGNDTFYPGTYRVFDGPWLQNVRGVGAFSFLRFPLTIP
jgi:tetratricopeptide (TPR) repeat protein